MTDGCLGAFSSRGSGGIFPQKICVVFHPYRTAFGAFSETDFWIYRQGRTEKFGGPARANLIFGAVVIF
jgi:hypothetical protein